MYRYSVDNAITYTSEDFVLFKESPFACWMERLTLENPDHGIPPDEGSEAPGNTMSPQDKLADTLRGEGKNVVRIDWEIDEPLRRAATLEAMRRGADFIVDGQLAVGTLSGSANLLMRTSGYSELGSFLYVPCHTQHKTTLHSALRLCFLADLLHSLQGQLPPQMLIIRAGSNVVPMHTEDHIYHYRAVKQRFMTTQSDFRKHRMPDPSESSHFGRWADCANEVLKQRALGRDAAGEQSESEQHETEQQESERSVIAAQLGDDNNTPASPYDLDEVKPSATRNPWEAGTLAEQARSVERFSADSDDPAGQPAVGAPSNALQNLGFIGSSTEVPTIGVEVPVPELEPEEPAAPDLPFGERRRSPPREEGGPVILSSVTPSLVERDSSSSHPLDSADVQWSLHDSESTPALVTAAPSAVLPEQRQADEATIAATKAPGAALEQAPAKALAAEDEDIKPFSNSLMTSEIQGFQV